MANVKLVAGNWKMHGNAADARALVDAITAAQPSPACDVLICPPAILIAGISGGTLSVGGQDCHWENAGAHTGDTSPLMLRDAGATAVILGHSERRQDHGEPDAVVAKKTAGAVGAGLQAIVCIGETREERDAGRALDVIATQLSGSLPADLDPTALVIAYEPVWAIGTGLVPTTEQIGEAHGFIRQTLVERFGAEAGGAVRILYGGSVKPANAAEIFSVADVDGALVGGASLKAEDFCGIIAAAS